MTQNKIEMKIMCEFLKGSCTFEQTLVCGERQAYAPNLAPRGLKKAQFFWKSSQYSCRDKKWKNIYIVICSKHLHDTTLETLKCHQHIMFGNCLFW